MKLKTVMTICVLVCFLFLVVAGLSSLNNLDYGVLEKTYGYTNNTPKCVDEQSGLYLLSYYFEDNNYGILAYLNDTTDKGQNGTVKSYIVGQKCISIMGTVIDVNASLNKKILSDLVLRLRDKLNGDNSTVTKTALDAENPYVISKNDDYIFIDYITGSTNVSTKAIYYRIIIQDARSLDVEMAEGEYEKLPDYLPNLLEVLKIPKYQLGAEYVTPPKQFNFRNVGFEELFNAQASNQ